MASSIPAPAPTELALAAMQQTRPRGRRMPWLMRLGLGVVALLAVLAVVAPWVVQDPERQSLRVRLKPPTLEGADGRPHLLGTDHLGRDVLARVVFGSRVSLVVGFSAVLVGGLLGSTMGLIAGYRGGRVDEVIMTLADAQLAFPFILLAIGIIAVLGPELSDPRRRHRAQRLGQLRAHPPRPGARAARQGIRGGHPRRSAAR